jgi:hypothetical protein
VTAERVAQGVVPRLARQRQFPVALDLAQPEKKMRREGRDGDAEKPVQTHKQHRKAKMRACTIRTMASESQECVRASR